MRIKRSVAIVLASVFLLSGCGKKEVVIDEYGTVNTDSETEYIGACHREVFA